MRSIDKTVRLTLAATAFGLISGWAQAAVILLGTPEGKPGDAVELSIAADAGTILESIDILPRYQKFAKVLALLSFQPSLALTQDPDDCKNNRCAVEYIIPKLFDQQTVLATFRFRVTSDAEKFVDVNGDRTYPFDLGVIVGVDDVPLPASQAFKVLAIPEPSSYVLLAAGILLLMAVRNGPRACVRSDLRSPA